MWHCGICLVGICFAMLSLLTCAGCYTLGRCSGKDSFAFSALWWKRHSMMIRIIVILVLVVINAPALHASNWYASPPATAGNGSITNPWSLNIALSSKNILPGDTLYLRGGNYLGPGFISTLSGTSNNYVTVRSYPGEWAVITDGGTGTLLTALAPATPYSSTNNIIIANSENWVVSATILIDGEGCQLGSKSGTNWLLNRGWFGTMPTNHAIGAKVDLWAGFIAQSGSYVAFRDFEICSTYCTNRVSGYATNSNGSVYYAHTNSIPDCAGLNLAPPGIGNKAINLIIHNVGHPGIGFWDQSDGGEINGCIIWGTGVYDSHSDQIYDVGAWTRGSGVYAHNKVGNVLLKNNMFIRNFTEGVNGYGALTTVSGMKLQNNVTMMNQTFGLAIYDDTVPTTNNMMWTNYFYMNSMIWGYATLSNRLMSVIGNTLVNSQGATLKNHLDGTFTYNTFFYDYSLFPGGALLSFYCPEATKASLSFMFAHNTYYKKNGNEDQFSFHTADITGRGSEGFKIHFANDGTNTWTAWTGWDSNSTYQASWPTNYLKVAVQQYDYDSNRWNICVVSTSGQTNTTIILSDYGFASGNHYQLVDAQNWPVVIASGTYTNGTINLPLNLTNVSAIPGIIPHTDVTTLTNESSNVKNAGLFNAFVLKHTTAPPTGVRVLR